jgi:hypothetical protein
MKVLDSSNGFCCTSDIVAGLDWVHSNRPDVDIVNMSLGTFALFSGTCDTAAAFTIALNTAVNNLHNNGVPVFASSGNEGSGTLMTAPACVTNAISVGAVWDGNVGSRTILGCTDATTTADQVTCFSNSNSVTDLFAPGAPTTSAGVGGGTSTFFGTSQASPLAAACAALLLEAEPGLSSAETRAAIKTSPVPVTDATNGLSFPRLDCEEALECASIPATTLVSPMGISLGDPVYPLVWQAIPGATSREIVWDRIVPAVPAFVFNLTAAQVGCPSGTGDCCLTPLMANCEPGGVAAYDPVGLQFTWRVTANSDCRTGATSSEWLVTVPPQRTLTVGKAGTGMGTVTSTDGGIDCGGDCQECYFENTPTELRATPSIDSEFSGFGGDADCIDGELDMALNTNCTAGFDPCSIDSIVDLPAQTVSSDQTFEACNILRAGTGGFAIESGATVVFRAGNQIALQNGLSIEAGAGFRAVNQ